ncbi:hypothetical protein D9757_001079 [Collybiopsis confluens]|uniref:Mitochondrial carrier n=1 Tax=Collybiopsis confluens TaxID=2823264 RepID=A0A8H5C651_9AGAR|nr:hypothetical protein D9757_015238 [Collybiopsis confluens]KAF5392769.1 hypothetical protein D9757_001079 [Collybiopsis confluens]
MTSNTSKMTSALPPLVQAVSGAIGSASANTLTYPLDLVTTRVQLASPEWDGRSSGKGKEKEQEVSNTSSSSHLQDKAFKILARLKAIRILRSIIRSDGAGALYDGILTDTAASSTFYIYSFLRKFLIRQLTSSRNSPTSTPSPATAKKPLRSVKLTLWQDLALGFLSGVASRAVSMPFSIITLRLQTGRHNVDEEHADENAVVGAVRKIYKEQGLSGFWRGFNTTILLSLNPSITLAFYQLFRRLLSLTSSPAASAKSGVLDPTPMQAFFGGAFSNSIAVAILYPLILAKTRLQASQKDPSLTSSQKQTLRTVMLDAYHGRYTHPDSSASVPNVEAQSARKSGLEGSYQGLEMQILKGFFNQGVTFLSKDGICSFGITKRIEQLLVQAYIRNQLGMGALAAKAGMASYSPLRCLWTRMILIGH